MMTYLAPVIDVLVKTAIIAPAMIVSLMIVNGTIKLLVAITRILWRGRING